MSYDVAIIGGGPGGYVAAIRAAQLGAKVLLVEKDKLGGVCLNRGCIPTKTLLNSADKWQELKRIAEYGLCAENIGFDFAAVMARKDRVVAQLQGGIVQLVKSNAIETLAGTATLLAPNRLRIEHEGGCSEYEARKIIIASGSAPAALPVPGGDLPAVITSDELLKIEAVPRSMVVVGAGAVGIEFAAVFQAFGCQVTVVEMMPAILPSIDGDLVKRMALILRKQGIKFFTGSKVAAVRPGADGVIVEVDTGKGMQQVPAEKVLAAAGRCANVEGLGLEAIGVDFTRKGIKVNAFMETNVKGIYAIGDITGEYMWAHAASAEGMAAAENALGGNTMMDYSAVPGCIYTTPEIAAVGLTEQAAQVAGKAVRVSRFNFAANGKAVSMGEAEGLVKIVTDDAGKVLGMHILGPHASDLIMEGVIAIRNGLGAEDIAHSIHPHPSLAETVMECAHGLS
ncbi:MAG: dihydrolipoyl dehydrogenase, partial [Negativicutes bacterium]|nr:dihydrolipoyl dehydrogenase [Negativicutes bacterium]